MSRPLLVAFDFDHTIVDDNTDIVARKLLPEEKLPDWLKGLYRTEGWTVYMRKMFEILHENAINEADISKAIDKVPAVYGMEELLIELNSHNCEIIVISDANSVLIEQWLRHKKLDHLVSRVFTNPAKYDENGLLTIEPYHFQDWCDLSTPNLCKGHILESYIKESAENGTTFDRVAYVGDGKNDFCPILRLSNKDLAFPRSDYPIVKLLNDAKTNKTHELKAQIFPWKDATDILKEVSKYFKS